MDAFFSGHFDARNSGYGQLETEAETSRVVQKDFTLLHFTTSQNVILLRKKSFFITDFTVITLAKLLRNFVTNLKPNAKQKTGAVIFFVARVPKNENIPQKNENLAKMDLVPITRQNEERR